MPRLIEVIQSEVLRGHNREDGDTQRLVYQYHTTEGDLLAEHDSWTLGQRHPICEYHRPEFEKQTKAEEKLQAISNALHWAAEERVKITWVDDDVESDHFVLECGSDGTRPAAMILNLSYLPEPSEDSG